MLWIDGIKYGLTYAEYDAATSLERIVMNVAGPKGRAFSLFLVRKISACGTEKLKGGDYPSNFPRPVDQ
jgi:hypothetical protein